jgi:hypothetical protein
MRSRTAILTAALFLSFPALAGPDVSLRYLPEPVRTAIERETQGAVIEDIEREERPDGVVYYEVEYEKGTQEWVLKVDTEGKVIGNDLD